MRTLLGSLIGLAVVATAGCDGSTSEVAGKVTYKGKPVVYGTVVMIGPDGVPKSGPIQPDGTYRVVGVKAGAVKAAVSSPPPPGSAPAGGKGKGGRDDGEPKPDDGPAPVVNPEVVKNWVALPEKYGEPGQSELNYSLQGGSNTVDIDLK